MSYHDSNTGVASAPPPYDGKAIALLRGSPEALFQNWASFVLGCLLIMGNAGMGNAMDAAQPALFMIFSGLVLAAAVRDTQLTQMPNAPEFARFAGGAPERQFLAWAGFISACFFTVIWLVNVEKDTEEKIALWMSTLMTLGSTLSLAKITRDRHDATVWCLQPADQQRNILDLCRGTSANTFAVWFTTIVALAAMAWGIVQAKCSAEARILFALATLFNVHASFTLAKTVRDANDPVLGGRITSMHKMYSWGGFFAALIICSAGIYWVDVDITTRQYMTTGIFFVAGSSLNLAKNVRDNEEANRIAAGHIE